jgi:PAS domain S-box-containing protein
MGEKTIPLDQYLQQTRNAARKPAKKWGEDLHYRALFEQTSECVFIIGMDFRYLAANQQALSLLGYEERELVGMPVSEVMSQDDALGRQAVLEDQASLYERTLKRKNGSTLPVEVSTSVVYDENGQPAYIQSIARDISERKNAEWILKRHTQILSVIGDATARLLRAASIEIKIPEVLESLAVAMDVSCCAIFEINTFSAEPFIQIRYKHDRSVDSPFDIPAIIGPFISDLLNLSSGYFSSLGAESRGASFSKPTFVAIPINGNLGSWGFLGFFTQRKKLSWFSSELDAVQTAANLIGSALQRNRYEETIRLNETRNRIILDALPDLLIRVDLGGVILDYSANSDHPLYLHRDMVTGKKLSQIWPEEIVVRIIGPMNEEFFVSPSRLDEFQLPYSNHTYEARLYPLGTSEALIVIRDITEQARLNEMKSDFINRASHELRTPLTAAILMIELIQEGGTTEELNEYWRTLKSELNRQKILIDRLLIAGRLESGMMKLEISSMDLIPALEESIMAVKPIANKGKVALKLTTQRQAIKVIGDKSGLQQVFINLINNAVKFSRQGGSVNIVVSENETEVLIGISDSGVGIPQQAIPHLFERFYRAKNVTIAEIPGSGIGLYIVKSIVEALGGTIQVDSVLNQGTTFTIHLKRFES